MTNGHHTSKIKMEIWFTGFFFAPVVSRFDWSINTATSSSQLGVTVLNDNSCWDDMRIVIDEGSFLNDFFEFRGFLYVVD